MAKEYCVETCKSLADEFKQTRLKRPARITRYEAGTDLVYEIRAVEVEEKARVWLRIEKFVGGGFAGQVYKVKITSIETDGDTLPGLHAGGTYAMKILIPPSNGSKIFRDCLYWLGYQGPFQLQVNPAAARASAIWLKIIRKAAQIRLGSADKIVDTYATFIDHTLGSCGQLNQWVEGRTWRLEVDENMDTLSQWRKGQKVNPDRLGSLEYRTKKKFMADVVKLFHEVGTPEFARQYEWSTCKSQPNCLKLNSTEDEPAEGLIAVDFSPGLALLCFFAYEPG